jgi:CRP-like cAMP-binding protein
VEHPQQVFAQVITRFEKRTPLSEQSRAALSALPFTIKSYSRHSYIVREGEKSRSAKLIVDGFAYRHKVTAEGLRQILSIHLPGDFIDLESSLLIVADHNVQAVQECTVAEVPRDAIVALIHEHGAVGYAMWIDTLIDASVYREWVVNVGRRDARRAMCHLLSEFGRRLDFAGLGCADRFELPMTQEQLADCLGLTPVHINRVLRDLSAEGLIKRHERFVEVPDSARLNKIAGFSDLYLHLDLMAA